MREDLLAYLWKTQKFRRSQLQTTSGQPIIVVKPGQENQYEGPDFFNAHIQIDNTLWVGNVELHVRSSDWFRHKHQTNEKYDNVVLHVVWDDDVPVFDSSQQLMPTLCLATYAPNDFIEKYHSWMIKSNKWTLCEDDLHQLPDILRKQFWERLYVELLVEKTSLIQSWLALSKNNWEAVFFVALAKGFGLKVNGMAFAQMALSVSWNVILRCSEKLDHIEALLMGQAGLLTANCDSTYYQSLQKKYLYLKHKNRLHAVSESAQFFRLRPTNSPTLRLAQLGWLLHHKSDLLAQILKAKSVADFYNILDAKTSSFWERHYHFDTPSKKRANRLTMSFKQLLLINAVFPFLFHYFNYTGDKRKEKVLDWMRQLPAEKNSYTKKFIALHVPINDALESQACLQLKNDYCAPKRCLQCAFGHNLLNL